MKHTSMKSKIVSTGLTKKQLKNAKWESTTSPITNPGKKKVVCKRFRVHALFDCSTCGKEWQNWENAREEAYKHALKTGHSVHGEVGTSYHYNHSL